MQVGFIASILQILCEKMKNHTQFNFPLQYTFAVRYSGSTRTCTYSENNNYTALYLSKWWKIVVLPENLLVHYCKI